MNAPAVDGSRRRFLTRLFTDPEKRESATGLQALDPVRRQTDGVMWAVAADHAGKVYVAGDDGMLFRREGDEWPREAFPAPLPIHALCPLGERLYSVGWLGLVCVRSEGQWQRVQGGESTSARVNLPLFDIAADGQDRLWAVGDQGRIVQYDGGEWREHDSGTTANLRSVLPLADGRVLAAGLGGTALVFDGTDWQPLDTGSGCPIVSMTQLGDGAVIAVGGEYDIEQGRFLGRLFLYSDGQWQGMDSEQPLPRLRRVRRSAEQLLICGDDGTAFRWTADGVTRLPTRLRHDLHDCLCLPDGRALICGDGGTLLEETTLDSEGAVATAGEAARWQQLSAGETCRTLRTALALGDGQVIAAGDGGVVLHIDGERVSLRQTPQQLRIHSLWGSSANNVFAACDDASILHFDGSDWQLAHRGNVDTALLAIRGFGPHDIFAVGDNGYALRYDGLMWRQMETGVRQELYGLWGPDSQHLLAVGGGGLILRWNGERWTEFNAGTDQDLYGVTGSGLAKLFICGLAGTLVRLEDNAWHRDFSGVRSDLHDVCHSGDSYFAVGSSGTILRNSDGIWEPEHSDVDCTLQAVVGREGEVYAVGGGGVVLRRA